MEQEKLQGYLRAIKADGKQIVTFKQGNTIFGQGDTAPSLFYMITGRAKVSVSQFDGRKAGVAGIIEPDMFFGEEVLNGEVRLSTVTAIERTSVVEIQKEAMIDLIREEPGFAEWFVGWLVHRNSEIQANLFEQLFSDTDRRLARTLLKLAHYGEEGGPRPISREFSQEVLSQMIGVTRLTLNQYMTKFRSLGFIRYNGDIRVNPSLLSVVIHARSRRKRKR